MPQLVLDARYFSHREQGVEMGVSISLHHISPATYTSSGDGALPVAAFDVVIITTWRCQQLGSNSAQCGNQPEPTPPITKERTLLMVGNCLTEVIMTKA